MKTGSIPHPEGVYYLAIRPEYLAMCDNDECGAAILNLFEFWYEANLARADTDAKPEPLDIRISVPKLKVRLLDLWGVRKINEELALLDKYGLIIKRQAKKDYDRRNAYTFNASLITATIDQWMQDQRTAQSDIDPKGSIHRSQRIDPSILKDRSVNNDSSIESLDSLDGPAKPEPSKKKSKAQKKPRLPQPTDGCFDAFCAGFARIQVLDLTKAVRQAWDWRAAQALYGDDERGCPGLLALLGIDPADAERLKALAPRITRFWHWYYRTHPDSELKDCIKILEYWTIWEAQEDKRHQKTVKGKHPADCPGGCGGLGQVEVKPGEWAICSGRKTA